MADKDSGRYRYEPYPSIATKQQNNGSNQLMKNEPPSTLKTACSNGSNIDQSKSEKTKRCCSCMGPKATSFWVGLLTNLGICTLLFGYTLLGKFQSQYDQPALWFIYSFGCRFIHFSCHWGWCINNATTYARFHKQTTVATATTKPIR